MPEAPLADRGSGLAPTGEGCFVLNVSDAEWLSSEGHEKRPSGSECTFESEEAPFPEIAVRLPSCFVGAGEEPGAILMVGARTGDWRVRCPVSELAAQHGASVARETTSPDGAYSKSGFAPSEGARPSFWQRLPWA